MKSYNIKGAVRNTILLYEPSNGHHPKDGSFAPGATMPIYVIYYIGIGQDTLGWLFLQALTFDIPVDWSKFCTH